MAYSQHSEQSRFSQIFSEELSCPVCLEELKEPKCLTSCAHNVCRECLEKMAARSTSKEITCPTCRRTTPLPETGVQGLPTSTVLVRLLEASPGRKERFDIHKALENSRPVVKRMEKKISELEKLSNDINLDLESTTKSIHDKADLLCEIVRKQEVSLCSEVDEFYQRKQILVQRQTGNLIKLHSNAANSVQVAADILSQSNVSEMVELASALIQQLDEVANLNLDESEFNPVFDEELVFNLNTEASKILDDRKIGKICHRTIRSQSITSTPVDWSRSGEVVFKLGHKGSKKGRFKSPAGVAVNEFGEIAITDFFNNRVQVFDSRLKFLFEFGKKGIEEGNLNGPTGIAYSPYNNIVVFDSKNSRVQIFNRKGEFVSKLGQHGCKPGEFGRQGSLFVDSSGDIIVTDTNNNRVEVFYNNGEFKLQFGHRGTEGFDQPLATVAVDDEYFTTDSGNNCIKVFNTDGEYVRQFGREGSGPGEFHCPRGLAIDPVKGYLLVTDSDNHNIQVFNLQGSFLKRIPTKKAPVALAIMQNNYILVCSYLGNCVRLLSYT